MNSKRKAFISILLGGMGGTVLSAAPALTADRTSVDFGAYPANQVQAHVFVLKNTGDQPLKIINIRKTCGCSETRLERDELAPGTTAKLTAVIKAETIAGPFSKNLFVESNDPKQRFLMLLMNGTSVPLVTVKPQDKIYAGTLSAGSVWRQELLLETNHDNVEFAPAIIKGMPGVDTELTAAGPRKFRLVVTLKAPLSAGSFNLQIHLPVKAPSGWQPVEIFISGRWAAGGKS